MNCVLFAKMDKIFSFKKTLKTGKVKEFCQSGKVGTMALSATLCWSHRNDRVP